MNYSTEIPLGTVAEVKILFAYPNNPTLGWSLEETIIHWFSQTLKRDGYDPAAPKPVIEMHVKNDGTDVTLTLYSDSDYSQILNAYAETLPAVLAAGLSAYENIIPKLKDEGRWDPRGKGWRFFMPFGMSMVNNKSLQFFHYPPEKMLNNLQDYLNDPVPYRIEDLLMQYNVPSRAGAQTYETIVDGAPIAAPDDAGSAPGGDPKWGLIPIQDFTKYQKEMVYALLRPHPTVKDYTIPLVVYGSHPREIFSVNFLNSVPLKVNEPTTAEIISGLTTQIIAGNHPYNFYYTAQVGEEGDGTYVGDGNMFRAHCKRAVQLMTADAITAGWQYSMAMDPSQDSTKVLNGYKEYWNNNSANAGQLCALVQAQATLLYTDTAQTIFKYRVPYKEASVECENYSNDICSFVV